MNDFFKREAQESEVARLTRENQELAEMGYQLELKYGILKEALEKIVEPPEFPIENNEAAIALRMNLIAHKALAAVGKNG